ncbi:3-oxoacyl-ACP reductase [Aeromicrobium duanguangcaii]|uniref:3-oxoacyl-ACP reductase n=1 Tax=Aeromicrobium duanguangcaii TaxID=2968086 RepID=A0ABY5KA55_9ACTN|nr:3-oxoacyl-ACP reductase [Aeromicrobium duanguangcaii]MCL3837304.1 3-oxoacyl-ACP reductase [Aeromicrobium duanguangcaii]UUI67336.1 3-oxoacyl-ACP reductase [Aeromicrobium duanguangcaii]
MSDRYKSMIQNPIGQFLVKNLGLPNPPELQRYRGGALVDGPVLVGGDGLLADSLPGLLKASGIDTTTVRAEGRRYQGLVLDASGIDSPAGTVAIQEFFTPVLRSLASNAKIVVIGLLPERTDTVGAAIAQRGLEGFVRSLGKEIGANGSTANLVYVTPESKDAVGSTLGFLLSPKSAFVDGQVVRLGTTGLVEADVPADPAKPLAGKVALVTGASRGLGAAMARTLHRDGAQIIGLDVPPLAEDLEHLMAELGGSSIICDITAEDAPEKIAEGLGDGVDFVVHNAGITRDKRLKNMKSENWAKVVDISVGAPERITAHLLDNKLIRPGGRIIGISSIAGIAGNNGQTNYGTAKAGVIGFVQALAPRTVDAGITVNAIAPGFIETDMVKTMPLGIREAGRRLSSLSQGGQPVDVAEAIAWYCHPGSSAISGNVVRVCGQGFLGA